MAGTSLKAIKARVLPTICDTYRSENGYAQARVEGRISKADFDWLCVAFETAEAENERLRDVLTWSEENCPGKCAGAIRNALLGK